MTTSILVTGATGFVGTHLVRALRAAGHSVQTHSSADGDIASCALVAADIGHVFHLAGRSFVPDSWNAPHAFYAVNVLGTVNVLDFCRRQAVPLTFVSSYVYGIPDRLPIAEDHPIRALNPYAHSKVLAEEAVRFFRDHFGVAASVVRPFNLYGPGQDARFLIPAIVGQALDPHCDRIAVHDLRPRRDYLHVADLVSLLLATMTQPTGGVYNAGSGASIGVQALVDEVNAVIGVAKPVYSTQQPRQGEVLDVVADIARARAELHWAPAVTLRHGLRDTVQAVARSTLPERRA